MEFEARDRWTTRDVWSGVGSRGTGDGQRSPASRDPHPTDEYIWFDHSEAVHPLDRTTAPDLPARHPFLLID